MRLLSERMNPEPPPNVLTTDVVSDKLRNQIRHIAKHYLDHENKAYGSPFIFFTDDEIASICHIYEFNKGIGPLRNYTFKYIDELLVNTKSIDYFDLIDIICLVLHKSQNFKNNFGDNFEKDLNDTLRENYIGYRIAEGMLVPITEPVMAEEVILPAFHVMHRHGLFKPMDELHSAFRHYGDGNFADALNSASKALETVIEMCLRKRSVEFEKGEKTSKKIDRLVQSEMVPSNLQDSMNSLSKMLGAVGNIRNDMSGHGSATEKEIPENLVQYQLDMAASSILYLVKTVYGN